VLFTTRDYSDTTAKHKLEVRAAIPWPHERVFTVCDVMKDPCKAHLDDYKCRINGFVEEMAKGRDGTMAQARRLHAMLRLIDEANLFAETFKFKTRFSAMKDINELRAKVESERARLAKIAKKTEKKEAEQAEKLEKWLKGEHVSLGFLPFDYMRVVRDYHVDIYEGGVFTGTKLADVVQTTRQAIVPIDDVKRIAPLVLKIIREGRSWKRNGKQIDVGDFSLDAITSDGLVLVGCHRFKKEEVERFASVLGL